MTSDAVPAMRRVPGRRPAIVIVGSVLLAMGGALFAGEVLLSVNEYFTGMKVYERAASDGLVTNDTAFAAVGVMLHLVPGIVGIFAGIVLVVLALGTNFGLKWARAVAWIFGMPILLWYGGLATLFFLGNVLVDGSTGSDNSELARRYEQAWPSWLHTVDMALMMLASTALLASLVCLTLPRADVYFRRREAPAEAP